MISTSFLKFGLKRKFIHDMERKYSNIANNKKKTP